MSSKRLSRNATAAVEAIEWRKVARPADAAARASLYDSDTEQAELVSLEIPEEAQHRLATLQRQWEEEAREAYQQGFRNGQSAATQTAAAQIDEKIQEISRTILTVAGYRSRIRREAEKDLVQLALAIARRLLRRELTVDPEVLLGVVKAGLERLDSREVHRVRIHPEHAGRVSSFLEGAGLAVEVVADQSLEPGAAIFETSRGALDAGLETQLSEIERGFTDLLPR